MRLILLEGPAVEPLTSAEAKARLNVGDEMPDEVMDAYITAARQQLDGADGWLGRALITQKWQGNLDYFPVCDYGRIYIPLPPLQTVDEVSYLGSDGVPVVMPETDYRVIMGPRPFLLPAYSSAWPGITNRADAISISFTVGYGDAGTDVPENIRTAIALGAGNLRSMSARNLSITEEVEEGIGSTRYQVNTNAGEALDYTAQCLLSIYRVIWL